jgi:N-acyl homoserine lactone hydrolase
MKLHAEPKLLEGPLSGGAAGATVTVEPMIGGEALFPPGYFEKEDGRLWKLHARGIGVRRSSWQWVPCPAFLIRHPNVGPVLVDTALHPSVAEDPKQNMGRRAAFLAGFRLEPGQDVPARLRARGIDPREISVVVMTHLHSDHTSCVSEFPASTFVVSALEWQAATTDPRPILRGYRPKHFDYVFDWRTVDYDGPGISSYSTFGRTFDLLGDGTIRLAFTPGHTAGHQAVICHLKERDFVVAGDAVYTYRQLEEDGPEPSMPVDLHNWRRSRSELQLFVREYPQAVIVPGHDPELEQRLEALYQ